MQTLRSVAFLATLTTALVPLGTPVAAQDDGGGMIQRFLQDSLSGGGREVNITGFEGLLAGNATMQEMTIADSEGVWLTLRDVVLDWNRAAMLRGNLSVEELSAGELIVARLPISDPEAEDAPKAPKAEATGFSLPELPVAIRVNKFAIERAELGEAVLGQAAELELDGTVILAGGEGNVELRTVRTDGPDDRIAIVGSFVNDTRVLALDVELEEEPGGLVSSLINVPGNPSLGLDIEGQGPLSDFAADIGLRTDGEDRVTGRVTLKGSGEGATDFAAEIGGDITPMLPPEFHDFFGEDIRLKTSGSRAADGALELPELTIAAESLSLDGNLSLGADGLPTAFALNGELADPSGAPVRLPVSGPGSFLQKVTLDAAFDASQGEQWTLDAVVEAPQMEGFEAETVALNGVGMIKTEGGAAITADLIFDVDGLALADDAMTQAVGDAVSGGVALGWQQGGALEITRLYADGADYGVSVLGDVRIQDRSVKVSGEGRVQARDLSRFSAISGQDLTGEVTADLFGRGDPLGGIFAISLNLEGQGLSIGQETADRLLADPVTVHTAVRRDTEGTVLDTFELRSKGVTADAEGRVGGGTSDLALKAALTDVGLVMPGHEGALTIEGQAREQAPGDWNVGVDLDGPYDLSGNVSGRVKPGESDVALDLAMPDISPLVEGHEGPVKVTGTAAETDETGKWALDLDVLGPYELTAAVEGIYGAGASDLALDVALPDISPLVPGHEGSVKIVGTAAEAEAGAWSLDLDADGPYDVAANVEGVYAPNATDVALALSLPDIAPLVPGHTGAVDLQGNVAQGDAGAWQFMLDGTGPYDAALDLDGSMGGGPGEVTLSAGLPDVSPLVPGLTGPFKAEGTAIDNGDGLWKIDFDAGGPLDGAATVDGVVGGGKSDLVLDISVPDLSPLVPQLRGPLDAKGTASEIGDGRWDVDLDVDGPYGAEADVAGAVGATGTDVALNIAVPDIAPLVPGHRGSVSAAASARQAEDGSWGLDVDAKGPYSSAITAGGTYGGGKSALQFEASLPDIAPVAPGLTGPVSLKGTAAEAGEGPWDVDLDAGGPYDSTAQIAGTVGVDNTAVDLTVSIPSVSPFAPGVSGSFNASGSVAQQADGYALELATNGPQGVSSNVSGTVAADFSTVNVQAAGAAPLGLANRALAPNSILGTANFDISVNGAPSLQAVNGTVSVNGAQLSLPEFQQTLNGITVQVGLNGENVQLDVSANGPAGGSVGANGTVQLAGGFNADLTASLDDFVLTDPLLYRTSLSGGATIVGPLLGGANVEGKINVGRTEIRVPDGGLGFGGAIPNMRHINEPGAVHLTRERAGLVEDEKKNAEGGGGGGVGGPVYGLDIIVSAPEQIFIRGRGLDTELGGTVVVTGTTANPNPVGEVEVIRGRLDILGQRLEMDDGTVSMAGGLQPYLDLTATSKRNEFEFLARITGPVDDPKFDLASVPDLPDDEVLARFLFGKSVTDLSALQAVQMASALATLAGKGGPGLLGGVRQGLGLDDLDLATTDDGETEVRAGKYISDNIYTEFVAGSDGDTEFDVNVDVSKNFTVKGTADSKGDSSIGIYFERDY
ncbi:autotransporter secretion inner membrane protein TamB [Aliiruegeria haliotis]|uniref:Autotransporter secretion inner membrane protein TamB n=1 Tax=Aliiruegeria haliotis TaxID=1280846 RepID=A0A2T0RGG6_9RHOB|nr:translocation/assembly module TamB domain-containing protein [Aliiruegeria haliotis]PRY20255.1 autotransporter secretion inner membrane protein TamB [Aliiruegeria haliotis]